METLSAKSIVADAANEQGTSAQEKTGLNRETLDTAPSRLRQHKVQVTGDRVLEAPIRWLKDPLRCLRYGLVDKKNLSECIHW